MPRSDRAPSLAMLRKEARRVGGVLAFVNYGREAMPWAQALWNVDNRTMSIDVYCTTNAQAKRALLAALKALPTKGEE